MGLILAQKAWSYTGQTDMQCSSIIRRDKLQYGIQKDPHSKMTVHRVKCRIFFPWREGGRGKGRGGGGGGGEGRFKNNEIECNIWGVCSFWV